LPTTALLKLELGDIRTFEPDFDPALTGFDGAELEALLDVSGVLQVEETAPEIDERLPIVTRSGDLWVLGNHRLICGDARDRMAPLLERI
jgi:hypothetical protein